VVEVKPEAVVVDGNHPLAGLALKYKITIREVRAATEAEIAAAATSFEEAEHAHGPDCDHDHDADGEKLVPLGKKPEGPPN
jgi:FKBP-type peptidyl-prolyl cis-trans isomerase SlyD